MAVIRPLIERVLRRRLVAPLVQPVLNIGHRGASGDAPENTLTAFELAARQGADGIELDVRLSADGVPVVLHDAWLGRTTSGTELVSELTARELKRLDAGSWFNRRYPTKARARYAVLRIPLLREALEWVRVRRQRVFIEIKGGRVIMEGIERKVLDEIYRAGVPHLATVISFDLARLRRTREMDEEISLGIVFTRALLALRRAQELGATTLLPHWMSASRRLVRRAHRAGLQVIAWNLNQPRWMRRRIADGVDGIMTNYPAILEQVRREYRNQDSI